MRASAKKNIIEYVRIVTSDVYMWMCKRIYIYAYTYVYVYV